MRVGTVKHFITILAELLADLWITERVSIIEFAPPSIHLSPASRYQCDEWSRLPCLLSPSDFCLSIPRFCPLCGPSFPFLARSALFSLLSSLSVVLYFIPLRQCAHLSTLTFCYNIIQAGKRHMVFTLKLALKENFVHFRKKKPSAYIHPCKLAFICLHY